MFFFFSLNNNAPPSDSSGGGGTNGGSGKKKQKVEEDESIGCKCGSRLDNKGMMLCCEKCELWSHGTCYRIKKKADVPETFFCETCVPPPKELDFSDVQHAPLRAMLEGDRDLHGFKPSAPRKRVKPSNEVTFKHEERLLLEKYWEVYARSDEEARAGVAAQVGRLLSVNGDELEHHFVLMAEDVLDGARGMNLAARAAPPGRTPPARQGKSSSLGPRTSRTQPPEPSLELRCAVGAEGGCRDAETCHCRAHGQECEAPAGRCVQCGCAMQCYNCALSTESPPAPYAVVPWEEGWKYVSVDAVKPFGFVAEIVGKVGDATATSKGYWTLPLRRDCREVFVPSLELVWDQGKHGNDTRFVRRSCAPNCEVRCVWAGSALRLGVWAGCEGVSAGQEVTVAWDRPWRTLTCHVPCACGGNSGCLVRGWYSERQDLASGLPVVQERIGTRRAEPQRPNKLQAELETTLNPLVTPEHKLSREDRKLQQVLRTIEKLEKHEKQLAKPTSSTPQEAAVVPQIATPISPAWKKARQSFDSTMGGDSQGDAFAGVATSGSGEVVAVHVATVLTPQSAGKAMGGKKAWLQKFSDAGEVPIEPSLPVQPLDHGLASPMYGWKKRAMLDAPAPFSLETLDPNSKKHKENGQ